MTETEKGHDPKLVSALRSLMKRLENTPEELRGPFLVKGLKPYLPAAPADTEKPAPDGLGEALDRAIARLQGIADYAGRPAWETVLRDELGAAFDQAQSLIAEAQVKRLEHELEQRLDHIKKLERRIHNQRRSNRDTWEIVEARRKWLGSLAARQVYARLLASFRKAYTRAETEIKRLTELADRLKLEAQSHASEARTANSTIYEIYQVLSGGKGEPGNWHGAEPAQRYVETAEARIKALEEALETVISAYDDCSGAEPSLSVLFRTIDIDTRATLNREKATGGLNAPS